MVDRLPTLLTQLLRTPALAAGVLLLSPAFAADGQRYSDPDGLYSVALPDGWVEMKPELVEAINTIERTFGTGDSGIVTGFHKQDQGDNHSPRILVLIRDHDWASRSLDSIEASVHEGFLKAVAGQPHGNFLRRVAVESVRLDREGPRIVSDGWISTLGYKLRVLSFDMIGLKKFVTLNCRAPRDQFDALRPDFDAVVDSFRFGTGQAFVLPTPANHLSESTGRSRSLVSNVLLGMTVVAMAVLLAFTVRALRRGAGST
jgi:hypothetical protein